MKIKNLIAVSAISLVSAAAGAFGWQTWQDSAQEQACAAGEWECPTNLQRAYNATLFNHWDQEKKRLIDLAIAKGAVPEKFTYCDRALVSAWSGIGARALTNEILGSAIPDLRFPDPRAAIADNLAGFEANRRRCAEFDGPGFFDSGDVDLQSLADTYTAPLPRR